MTTAIALREDLGITLDDLISQKRTERSDAEGTDIRLSDIVINAEADNPTISIGSDQQVPVTGRGYEALADAVGVPLPFLKRLGSTVGSQGQARVLSMLLEASDEVKRVNFAHGGILDVKEPGSLAVTPVHMLDVALNTLGTGSAPVQRLVDTSSDFSFDVHVPLGSERGVGGDASAQVEMPEGLEGYSWVTNSPVTNLSRVGDITAAGLRMTLDMKRSLSPSVQPWMMRLACTNGMETTTNLTKVDARGMTIDEVMADINAKAEIAFSRVEREIEHFYQMRENRVGNPERTLRAIARERGIPDRRLMAMLDLAPEALGDNPTEFDIVNTITNLANRETVRNNGARLSLERAGGGVVADHAVRCSTCQTTLSH